MRRIVRFGLPSILFVALLLSACGGASNGGGGAATPSGPAGDAAVGQTKYTSSCAACHGPDATGIVGLGKDLTTSQFTRDLSNAEYVEFIRVGRPTGDPANTTGVDMPPKGGNPALTDQDLADIVAYLRTLER
jgi:mono/diheme cytochrome c family protein